MQVRLTKEFPQVFSSLPLFLPSIHPSFHPQAFVKYLAQMVKCLPAVWETQVRSLGWEDALEKEMATHSSVLAWTFPWTEEPGGLWSMGTQESDRSE